MDSKWDWKDLIMLAATIIATVAAVIALIKANEANILAQQSNNTANKANVLSQQSNEIAKQVHADSRILAKPKLATHFAVGPEKILLEVQNVGPGPAQLLIACVLYDGDVYDLMIDDEVIRFGKALGLPVPKAVSSLKGRYIASSDQQMIFSGILNDRALTLEKVSKIRSNFQQAIFYIPYEDIFGKRFEGRGVFMHETGNPDLFIRSTGRYKLSTPDATSECPKWAGPNKSD